MRSFMLVAMLVPLLVLAGCAKRTAKKPSADDSASGVPSPVAAGDKDSKKEAKEGDAPNWLTDPRYKKEKSDDPATGKQPWGLTPPQGGWQANANPANGGQPRPPGTGVLQPQAQPEKPPAMTPPKFSPVSRQDMFDLQVFIHDASLAAGKMPAPATIYRALVAAKSPAAELVKDGSIILTGATQRDGVWAYEARAILQGGLAVSQNGVETLTAEQLKARLGK